MNHEVFRNVGVIVLIEFLRQVTMSVCSHICKQLKSQQLCQLHQFSKKYKKHPLEIPIVGLAYFKVR